ncbi:MAG: hypothetical protein HQK51_06660 [Oligoflexia bacterium]|nr:hypothetical protein [Oligoflexia bacterium]
MKRILCFIAYSFFISSLIFSSIRPTCAFETDSSEDDSILTTSSTTTTDSINKLNEIVITKEKEISSQKPSAPSYIPTVYGMVKKEIRYIHQSN